MPDPKVNIHIGTTSDNSGTQKAEGFLGKLKSQLKGIADQVPGLGRIGSVLSTLATGPVAILTGGVAALAGAWTGAHTAVDAYIRESQKVAKLDAALAQQGQLTKDYRSYLMELASQLQATTAVADDEWYGILQKLVQFGAKKETIGLDVETVKNLAGLMGGGPEGLAAATSAYSRALQGSFTLFQQYGIVVDANATATAKLAQIQQLAAERGSGILEASAESLGGQLTQLKNETGDLAEGFGRLIARTGLVQGAVQLLRDGVGGLNELVPQTTRQTKGLVNQLNLWKLSTDEVKKATEGAVDSAQSLADIGIAAEIKASKDLTGALQKQLDKLREVKQFQDALAKEKLAQDIASIDAKVASGALTQPQADAQKYQLQRMAAAGNASREQDLAKAEVGARQNAIDESVIRRTLAASQLSSAEYRLSRTKEEAAALQQRAGDLGVLSPLAQQTSQKHLAAAQGELAPLLARSVTEAGRLNLSDADRARIAALQQTVSQESAKLARNELAPGGAKAEARQIFARADELKAAQDQLTQKVSDLRKIVDQATKDETDVVTTNKDAIEVTQRQAEEAKRLADAQAKTAEAQRQVQLTTQQKAEAAKAQQQQDAAIEALRTEADLGPSAGAQTDLLHIPTLNPASAIIKTVSDTAKTSQDNVAKAAGAIGGAAQKLPPPLSAEALVNAFSGYQATILQLQQDNQRQVDLISRQVQILQQQLANSRNQG